MGRPHVLVVQHSSQGHTAEVAERAAAVLRAGGATVDLVEAGTAPSPAGYDGVVLGDPVHLGRHSRDMRRYATTHRATLTAMPTAMFQLSLASAGHGPEDEAEARSYLDAFCRDTGLDPDLVGLFAGALVYTRYGWVKRRLMRRIATKQGLDTDTTHDHDYTDWDAVDAFAGDVLALVRAGQTMP
jgi:menaquinone-dependent protoporphyrinogen oxidase